MVRDVQFYLITPITVNDEYGIPQPKDAEKKSVLGWIESVNASEYFEGGRNGLHPEYRFKCFFDDYNGQEILEYEGEQYTIYRTYLGKMDTIELYVERRGKTNGKVGSGR